MDQVRFVLLYNGCWNDSGEKYKYDYGKIRALSMPMDSSYRFLHETVCRIVGFSATECNVKMKFNFNCPGCVPPIEIRSDDDVRFFLAENSNVATRCALCISVEDKRNANDEDGDDTTEQPQQNAPSSVNSIFNCGVRATTPIDHVVGRDDVHEGVYSHINNPCVSGAESSTRMENAVCNQPNIQPQEVSRCRSKAPSPTHVNAPSPTHVNPNSGTSHGGGNYLAVEGHTKSSTSSEPKLSKSFETVFTNVKNVKVGDFFDTKEEVHLKFSMLAIKNHYQFRVSKSTKGLLVLTCYDKNCKWRVRATKLKGADAFRVRKYQPEHTCNLDSLHLDHRQASSKLIGHCVKSKFEGISLCYRPNDIIEDMKKHCGMTFSYSKAWRAREVAMQMVRGSSEHSFRILPSYFHMLQLKNPDTVTDIAVEADDRFKYLFMALGASIIGFRSSIRPVIAIDGTLLKCKHQYTLFIATTLDGNNQVYPLAFGIGDSENDCAWTWFFEKLHGLIGDVENLVFISDRNTSITAGIARVFPNAVHGLCMYHLGQNIKSRHKGVDVHGLFCKAAKAYQVLDFNQLIHQIREIDSEVAQDLFDANYIKWARSHFDGRRYSIMTTNIAECLNEILKDACELLVTKLLDHIRSLLQKWFWERHEAARKMNTPVTKWVDDKLRSRKKKAECYRVHPINLNEYQVMDGYLNPIVNTQDKTCTCRQFQLEQMPCKHAIAVCSYCKVSSYDYCSPFYTKDALLATYAISIHPVGHEEDWTLPDDVKDRVVLPPRVCKARECPPKKRKRSKGEGKIHRKCGRCGVLGHNRQNCSTPVP